ncbi:MAG TPA: YciI family protein [bacterium]|jgi:hypothetical protein|nr:YciI family protein [bacterium]
MQFLALIYQNEQVQQRFTKEEWGKIYAEYGAVTKDLTAQGQLLAGYGLQPVGKAVTVRSRDGQVSSSAGPAYATEDSLSGVNLIEAPDLESATRIAAKLPSVRWGSVEVRPLMEYKSTSEQTYKK